MFPQPVGLAATWDAELVERVGEVAAVEVRAKRAENPLVSLNVWAPVVNTLRHPAWGRNEEGYSEDPHLTAQFGTAYSRGLRGDHPRVWRTVPALKHFLAYNNETDRSVDDVRDLSLRTLHEEELPAFRGAIEAGRRGRHHARVQPRQRHPRRTRSPSSSPRRGRGRTSRSRWYRMPVPRPSSSRPSARSPTTSSATAALVRSGLDSFTDNDANAEPTIGYLREALAGGLLTTDDIDRAVMRLLELRIRTGEFDGDDDPYAGIGVEAIDRPSARALAREAVARSVVVLRNDDGVLPLPDAGRVAVVGPLADAGAHRLVRRARRRTRSGSARRLAERFREVEVVTGADTVALRAASNGRYVVVAADGCGRRGVGRRPPARTPCSTSRTGATAS